MKAVDEMPHGEFDYIRAWTSGRQSPSFLRASGVIQGIGDDAAVTDWTPGMQMVISCDTMVEEIHFKTVTIKDRDCGYKAMAAAISDLAAMGANPKFALVSVSMPKGSEERRLQDMYSGLYECADRWGVAIVGGDTTASVSGISLTVTVIGEVEAGKALLRSSAKVGDVVFVTGFPGRSAAGLDFLLGQNKDSRQWEAIPPGLTRLIEAHCRPVPQVKAGRLLQELGVCHALNDISDGLASEAWEIVEASGLGIDLIEDRIPLAEELLAYARQKGKDPIDFVLYGGEDYELIGTMPAGRALETQIAFKDAGLTMHIIGYVNGDHRSVMLAQSNGALVPVPKHGYNHFGKE
jgi:thiamine-monophosphate kinase